MILGVLIGLLATLNTAPNADSRPATVMPAPAEASGPVLLTKPLLSADDYPADAVAAEFEGTVAVAVRVDQHGKVSDCIVEGSSGLPSLDSQTCRIMWLRARFDPALDQAGKPVAGVYRQRVTWRLQDSEPYSTEYWGSRIVSVVDRGGNLLECKAELTGVLKSSGKDRCAFQAALSPQARRPAGVGFKGDRLTVVTEAQFAPEGTLLEPHMPVGPRERVYSSQTSLISVSSSGKVTDCKPVHQDGLPRFTGYDQCEEIRGFKFKAREVDGKPKSVTGFLMLGQWISD